MTDSLSILVIESDPNAILFLLTAQNTLQTKGIEPQFRFASNLDEGLNALNDRKFDIIITDLYVNDSQGLNTFIEIQKRTDSIPIIIVGESTEDELELEAIKLGAQDFLPKSDLNVGLLARTILHAIERHRLHENLKALSFTDELTGVYNRRGFFTFLEQQIALARRMQEGFYLFIIDFDYLKHINDSYGHLIGDRALIDMAQCLRTSFRRHDITGRIGGDEFGVIVINAGIENGDFLKQHLFEKLREYNTHIQEPYRLSFSIGKAYFDGMRELTINDLFSEADSNLYQEKLLTHAQHHGSPPLQA